MCGIVGWFGNELREEVDTAALDRMMVFNSTRGIHSSGVFNITSDGTVGLHKEAQESWHYIHNPGYQSIAHDTASRVVIGHCRHATVGEKTADNAHPFSHKHITGVHNGSLTSATKRAFDRPYKEGMGTDSESFYRYLADNSFEDAIALMDHAPSGYQGTQYSKMYDAFTFVWWNSVDRTLNMIRNTMRPLMFSPIGGNKVSEHRAVVIASEDKFISSGFGFDPDTHEPESTKPFHLFTIPFDEGMLPQMQDIQVTDYSDTLAPTRNWYGGGSNSNNRNTNNNNHGKGGPNSGSNSQAPFHSSGTGTKSNRSKQNSSSDSSRTYESGSHNSRFTDTMLVGNRLPDIIFNDKGIVIPWSEAGSVYAYINRQIDDITYKIGQPKGTFSNQELRECTEDFSNLVELRGILEQEAEINNRKLANNSVAVFREYDPSEFIRTLYHNSYYTHPAGNYADQLSPDEVLKTIKEYTDGTGECSYGCGTQISLNDPQMVIDDQSEYVICGGCVKQIANDWATDSEKAYGMHLFPSDENQRNRYVALEVLQTRTEN